MGRYIFADVAHGRDKDQASYSGIQIDVEYIIPNSTWSTFKLYVFLKNVLQRHSLLICNLILMAHLLSVICGSSE